MQPRQGTVPDWLHLDRAVGLLAVEALCGDTSHFAAAEAPVLQDMGDTGFSINCNAPDQCPGLSLSAGGQRAVAGGQRGNCGGCRVYLVVPR